MNTTATTTRSLLPAAMLALGAAFACFGMGALWYSQQQPPKPVPVAPQRPTLRLTLGDIVQRFNEAAAKYQGLQAREDQVARSEVNARTWRVAYRLSPHLTLMIDTDSATRAPVTIGVMGVADGTQEYGLQAIGALVSMGQAAFGPGDPGTGQLVDLCNSGGKPGKARIKGLDVECSLGDGLTIAAISAPEPTAPQ